MFVDFALKVQNFLKDQDLIDFGRVTLYCFESGKAMT